jgi:hypothetical protein
MYSNLLFSHPFFIFGKCGGDAVLLNEASKSCCSTQEQARTLSKNSTVATSALGNEVIFTSRTFPHCKYYLGSPL